MNTQGYVEKMKHLEDLLWLKDALNLSMADLALALDVSRPQLYHWLDLMSPPDPKQQNISRLRQWIEANVEVCHLRQLKLHWHQPIHSNITLIYIFNKIINGQSLGKIKKPIDIKALLRFDYRALSAGTSVKKKNST